MGLDSYSAKLIHELLEIESIVFTSPGNVATQIAELWATGAIISVIHEHTQYTLTQTMSKDTSYLPETDLILNIQTRYKEITNHQTLLDIKASPLICSLEDTLHHFFDQKMDYLYFSSNNTFLAFKDNLAAAYKFAQKKNQQLKSKYDLEKERVEKKEQTIRALKLDLLVYKVVVWIPGMRLIGRLLKLIEPRLGNLYQYHPRDLAIPDENYLKISSFPKISIVTPSFNQGTYLEATLQSVFNQEYPNLEYFVKDGGSKDESVSILQHYKSKLTGWISEPDKGQSHAINIGFTHTTGEIMAWLNSDDLLLPRALNRVAEYFNSHPEIDVLYGNRLLIDKNNKEIGRWLLPGHNSKALSWADFIPQETLFWRRRLWEKVGSRIDESFYFAMDWDLIIRFRDAGARFDHIPHFLGAFRVHEYQKTSAETDIGLKEMQRIQMRIFKRLPTRKEIRKALLPFVLRHIAVDLIYRVKCRLRRKKYKLVPSATVLIGDEEKNAPIA